MKKPQLNIGLIVLLLSFGLIALSYPNRNKVVASNRVTFGVKIGILPTGGITQYALVYCQGSTVQSIQSIPLNQLIKIGQGEWPIPRTNHFFNFFEEYGLYDDTLADGSIIDYGAAFDSLWKIRFTDHPFDRYAGKGWSQGNARPSLEQQKYIYDRYGVRGYDQDYFIDTSFFRLLKDVMNTEWIEAYKSLH